MTSRPKLYSAATSYEDKLTTAALLAVDIALLMQMLQLSALDMPLSVSLYCLSASIPLLVLHYFELELDKQYKLVTFNWYLTLTPAAWVGSIVALAAAFLHFSIVAAIVFASTSLFAFIALVRYGRTLVRINAEVKDSHSSSTDDSHASMGKEPPSAGT